MLHIYIRIYFKIYYIVVASKNKSQHFPLINSYFFVVLLYFQGKPKLYVIQIWKEVQTK